MREDLIIEIEIPEGLDVQESNSLLKVKGPKGEVEKNFIHPKVHLKIESKKIVLESKKSSKMEKKVIHSFAAHIKNMFKGVQEPHVYKLKICSGHFPMNVSVSGKEITIKNFFGESVPRKTTLPEKAEVKVNGDEIVITSADKEAAGQAAAKIESLCRITKRDIRIFQDGCYITEKAGKIL